MLRLMSRRPQHGNPVALIFTGRDMRHVLTELAGSAGDAAVRAGEGTTRDSPPLWAEEKGIRASLKRAASSVPSMDGACACCPWACICRMALACLAFLRGTNTYDSHGQHNECCADLAET